MTWYSARKRKLLEQPLHSRLVLGDGRINLAVSPFQIRVRHHSWAAVSRAADVNDVQIVFLDDAIQVNVNEIESRRRPPMAEQTRLDVLPFQWAFKQWIVQQINLANGKIIRCAPIRVYQAQQFVACLGFTVMMCLRRNSPADARCHLETIAHLFPLAGRFQFGFHNRSCCPPYFNTSRTYLAIINSSSVRIIRTVALLPSLLMICSFAL